MKTSNNKENAQKKKDAWSVFKIMGELVSGTIAVLNETREKVDIA